jgi:hypothetical protein
MADSRQFVIFLMITAKIKSRQASHSTTLRNLHFSPKSQQVKRDMTHNGQMMHKNKISVRHSEANKATWKTNARMEAKFIINHRAKTRTHTRR